MDLETKKYVGNTVEAVQLSRENAEEVAAWVDGKITIKTFEQETDEGKTHTGTKLRVNIKPHRVGAWRFGSIGDWFVKDESGIVRIFPNTIFLKIFHEKYQDAVLVESMD